MASAPTIERPRGARRVVELWRRFRNERDDPAPFYRLLAAEVADKLEARHGSLRGKRILDLGCGPGWYTEALRAKGADVVPLEYELAELTTTGAAPAGALLGDAGRLPFPDAGLDAVVCSNMLEHAPDTEAVFTELRRVLTPGGWAYVSWTNWYSPWGGHDMSPWHLLGPRLGPRIYERRNGGPPRKNRYGEGLFAVHIGPTLRLVEGIEGLAIERAEPRYWPWARAVLAVPGVREVVTWNCVLHLRRTGDGHGLPSVLAKLDDVAGWMSDAQARRLWDRASELRPGATVVEIGSYQGRSTSVLARAVPDGSIVVAVDPHAGNDRGPQQWEGTADEGEADHRAFLANLARLGVGEKVRHVRRFSHDALDEVEGEIDLLYIDGAHGFGPARDDIVRWGDRVAPGGTMLIHDAYSSVGVTLALLTTTVPGGRFRYLGRSGSMVEFRREPVGNRFGNAARQLAEWPWFLKNLVVKLLIVAGLRQGTWPY